MSLEFRISVNPIRRVNLALGLPGVLNGFNNLIAWAKTEVEGEWMDSDDSEGRPPLAFEGFGAVPKVLVSLLGMRLTRQPFAFCLGPGIVRGFDNT